ncbi:probable G-protein coupled receptor 139 [Linepithema humile]|uniref:probable G-protein coupled receptor 139 n=1 Tax=Linepithema humile TaxID=83485 RepID=UPI00351EE634
MDDEYIPALNVMKHIEKYYLPIFLCLSLLGNILSVCVLFCTKLRYNSSSIFLGALAISDIGVLVTVFVNWFKQIKIINEEYWLLILLDGFFQTVFCFLSVWIVVAFTVQRYIVIKWPLLRRSLCTVNQAIIIVIGLAGLAVLYSIFFWLVIWNTTYKNSNIVEEGMIWIICTINAIITSFLPAIMIVIFNSLIVYNVRKQNRIRGNMISSFSASNKNTQSSDKEASHIEVTKMLVIISTLFICLNIPIHVALLCFSYRVRINIYC